MARTQLADDRGVHVEITAVGIERVVDRNQPRVLEDLIRHPARLEPVVYDAHRNSRLALAGQHRDLLGL